MLLGDWSLIIDRGLGVIQFLVPLTEGLLVREKYWELGSYLISLFGNKEKYCPHLKRYFKKHYYQFESYFSSHHDRRIVINGKVIFLIILLFLILLHVLQSLEPF